MVSTWLVQRDCLGSFKVILLPGPFLEILIWLLRWKVKGKVAQSRPTLFHPRIIQVHGILQARIRECVAFPFSREPSAGIEPRSPNCRRILYQLSHWETLSQAQMELGRQLSTRHMQIWPWLLDLSECNFLSLPWWLSGKESVQCRRRGFNPSSGKIPRASEQLSPSTTTTEPVLRSCSYWSLRALEPMLLN